MGSQRGLFGQARRHRRPRAHRDSLSSLKRRSFLGWSAAVGGAVVSRLKLKASGPSPAAAAGFPLPHRQERKGDFRIVRTGCPSHNCGGRCLLKVTVYDGKIVRIEGDDRPGDGIENPQLRPCIRGRAYRQRQDWVNARYILMWSWNPCEMRGGTNSEYFLRKAKERGARIICLDPRMTLSAVALADEWIPIRPGTDTSMMSAMAYVMIAEKLYDAAFVATHCLGFDETQPPACVAACPMRALGYGDLAELRKTIGGTADVFPLPESRDPGPALLVKPHRDAARANRDTAEVANWEEV